MPAEKGIRVLDLGDGAKPLEEPKLPVPPKLASFAASLSSKLAAKLTSNRSCTPEDLPSVVERGVAHFLRPPDMAPFTFDEKQIADLWQTGYEQISEACPGGRFPKGEQPATVTSSAATYHFARELRSGIAQVHTWPPPKSVNGGLAGAVVGSHMLEWKNNDEDALSAADWQPSAEGYWSLSCTGRGANATAQAIAHNQPDISFLNTVSFDSCCMHDDGMKENGKSQLCGGPSLELHKACVRDTMFRKVPELTGAGLRGFLVDGATELKTVKVYCNSNPHLFLLIDLNDEAAALYLEHFGEEHAHIEGSNEFGGLKGGGIMLLYDVLQPQKSCFLGFVQSVGKAMYASKDSANNKKFAGAARSDTAMVLAALTEGGFSSTDVPYEHPDSLFRQAHYSFSKEFAEELRVASLGANPNPDP